MNYDNKQLGHENSSHPMHDEEQEITFDLILGRLTIDESDFLENHIANLLKDAKRPFENAKRLQKEINALRATLEYININTWGGTEAEYNMEFSKIYRSLCDTQNKLNQLLTRP